MQIAAVRPARPGNRAVRLPPGESLPGPRLTPPDIKNGFAIWLTGLPSSGKTTLAFALGHLLLKRGILVQVLDSDALRKKVTPHPTYTRRERDAFYHLLGFLAGFLTECGINVLVSATAPRQAHRDAARQRISRFAEVYLACPGAVCRARDAKGLWARADRGEITNLPGAGAPYEAPERPEVCVDTARTPADKAARQVLKQLREQRLFHVPQPGR
jgi:adenylylsulfate kinase